MVNDFSSKEIFYESILFQRHPLFFERTTSLVTMEEKTGAEVRPSGWYNLGAILAEVEFVHAVSAGGSVKFLPAV